MNRPKPGVSLMPLNAEEHQALLQQVYRGTPGYWQMYGLPATPDTQAERDLHATAETPGRNMLGIVQRADPDDPAGGVEMIGVVDFRLHWPAPNVVYIGMVMVAQPYQRQGVGTAAWQLLQPWLAQEAQMEKARLGVEQFNPGALRFFQANGFSLTGETDRVQSGSRWIRLLYMDYPLQPEPDNTEPGETGAPTNGASANDPSPHDPSSHDTVPDDPSAPDSAPDNA